MHLLLGCALLAGGFCEPPLGRWLLLLFRGASGLLLLAVRLMAGLLLVLLVLVGRAWGSPIWGRRVSCMLRRVCSAIGRCVTAWWLLLVLLLLVLRVLWRCLCRLLAIGWVGSRGRSSPGRGSGSGRSDRYGRWEV